MISWHKPGQGVTPVNGIVRWTNDKPGLLSPIPGVIYRIRDVALGPSGPTFFLWEFPDGRSFASRCFRPVYPTEVENLKRLCVTPPTKVKEDA